MKKFLLHIVLVSYMMVMLKPALPYVSDLVGHVFFYAQHMATVHYENGKMHIHKEIVDNAKKEASQKELPASKKDNSANDHINFAATATITTRMFTAVQQAPINSVLHDHYLYADYPPPRA